MMMEEKFYRFRNLEDWNADRFLSEMEDIAQNQLTFIDPKEFNDPFDCNHEMIEDNHDSIQINFIMNLLYYITELKNNENILPEKLKKYNYEELYIKYLPLYLSCYEIVEQRMPYQIQLKEDFEKKTEYGAELKKIISQEERKKRRKEIIFSEEVINRLKNLADNFTDELKDDFLYNFYNDLRSSAPCTLGEYGVYITDAKFHNLYFNIFALRQRLEFCYRVCRKYKMGVSCFAKDIKSQYYWAHYANSHKGYAIEYSFDMQYKDILSPLNYPHKVFYANTRQGYLDNLILEEKSSIQKNFFSKFFVKSSSWKQEEEYRMLSPFFPQDKNDWFSRKVKDYIALEANPKITAIYLGMRFDESSKKAKHLFEIAKKSNIKLYKMKTLEEMEKNENFFSMSYKEFEVEKAC